MITKLMPALCVCAGVLAGQTPAAGPAFEVASVKTAPEVTPAMVASGKIHAGMKIDAARVDIGMMSVMDLICKAYEVKRYQVTGPSWLQSQFGIARFDIVAKIPEGGTKEQVPRMLQALLAERFKLAAHKEKKDQPVYALVVAKGGPKLKETAPDPAAASADTPDGAKPPASTGSNEVTFKQSGRGAVVTDGQGKKQSISMSPDGKTMTMDISGTTMQDLAEGLSPMVDKPIVDMTGLKGKYDVTIELSMQELMAMARSMGAPVPAGQGAGDSGRPADAASHSSGSSLFAAIQKLGLKLEPRKAPFDIIVVDRVEKAPTEN